MTTRSQKRTINDLFGEEPEINVESENNDRLNDNRAKRLKVSIPKILDGQFFDIISNENGKVVAKCKECGESKKGHLSTTGNFKSHYRMKHPVSLSKLTDYLSSKSTEAISDKKQQNLNTFICLPEKVFSIFFIVRYCFNSTVISPIP